MFITSSWNIFFKCSYSHSSSTFSLIFHFPIIFSTFSWTNAIFITPLEFSVCNTIIIYLEDDVLHPWTHEIKKKLILYCYFVLYYSSCIVLYIAILVIDFKTISNIISKKISFISDSTYWCVLFTLQHHILTHLVV